MSSSSDPYGSPQPQFHSAAPDPERKTSTNLPWIASGIAGIVVGLVVGFVIGRGGEDGAEAVSVAATPTVEQAPAASGGSKATTPSAASAARFTVGETQTTTDGMKATPLALENPSSRVPDLSFRSSSGSGAWTVLDAELCAGSKTINKTGYGFTLIDAEHRTYKSYDSTSQPFKPTISGGSKLAPGECARGFVNFQLPDGVKIVSIRWEYPGDGGPFLWTL